MAEVNGSNLVIADDARKKRIKRIKHTIVAIIVFLLVFPTVICILMFAKVCKLEKEVLEYKEAVQVAKIENEKSEGVKILEEALYDAEINTSDSVTDTEVLDSDTDTDNKVSGNKDESNTDEYEGKKKVYLTFDDGPSENTDKILDILKEYDVKATFFVNGRTSDENKERLKRIVNEGHTIGMHSYSHDYYTIYDSLSNFKEDYNKISQFIEQTTGVKPVYYRFPGGSSTTTSKQDIREFISFLNGQGAVYLDWNVQNGDATNTILTPDELIGNILNDVKKYDNSIVLMHDAANRDNTVKSLPKLIRKLRKMDAVLLKVDEDTPLIRHVEY